MLHEKYWKDVSEDEQSEPVKRLLDAIKKLAIAVNNVRLYHEAGWPWDWDAEKYKEVAQEQLDTINEAFANGFYVTNAGVLDFEKKEQTDKRMCDCGWKGTNDDLKEIIETRYCCPECEENTEKACSVDGCWRPSTCGTLTKSGYQWTCNEHKPESTRG